ncbi:hypothetical protein ASD53_09660 [Lysobacter sp. Root559]|nr:hypothetical protein ASD53_09660 [Lysobacter sp. Root559]KRA74498.1 hypothetical protein ASD78_13625 [Lysobacter sp. Root667]KRC34010.1 hypothetical protein ASE10_13845 [Lysobacter sp. Root76]KRD69344.1 hypothetical protein ASE45_09285 [Lysobacter sp. Root96]
MWAADPRIDTSSDEALRKSLAQIDAELTPAQREQFIAAVIQLDLANPRFRNMTIDQIMQLINGKTAVEIIEFANAPAESR